MISFQVPGLPVPQGSMKAFVRGNRAMLTHNNSEALKNYRARVAYSAQQAGARVTDSPVEVDVLFHVQRPKGHFGTGKNAGVLKDSAPRYPTTKPDIDKLLRSVLDALTGVCFVDDSQVIEVTVSKNYADDGVQPGTCIDVMEVERKEVASA